jgi:hypothetical protein
VLIVGHSMALCGMNEYGNHGVHCSEHLCRVSVLLRSLFPLRKYTRSPSITSNTSSTGSTTYNSSTNNYNTYVSVDGVIINPQTAHQPTSTLKLQQRHLRTSGYTTAVMAACWCEHTLPAQHPPQVSGQSNTHARRPRWVTTNMHATHIV